MPADLGDKALMSLSSEISFQECLYSKLFGIQRSCLPSDRLTYSLGRYSAVFQRASLLIVQNIEDTVFY